MSDLAPPADAGTDATPARTTEIQIPHLRRADTEQVAATAAWQSRLLPFLVWMLGGVTVFFLVATLVQLNGLQRRMESPPRLDLAAALSPLDAGASSTSDRLMFAQWKTLATLEQHALERRYHQANVLLMSRTWTRYLGFMTGMIMALMGAAFIMGKLREEASTLELKNAAVQASLATTSPGLVLCVLGTLLMLTTLVVHNDIETRDTPLYTQVLLAPDPGGAGSAPLPLPLSGARDPLEETEEVTDPLAEPELPAPAAEPRR